MGTFFEPWNPFVKTSGLFLTLESFFSNLERLFLTLRQILAHTKNYVHAGLQASKSSAQQC